MTNRQPRKYAERGKAKRITVSLVLPAHQVKYLRTTAKQRGSSISAVASELYEIALFGDSTPEPKAS